MKTILCSRLATSIFKRNLSPLSGYSLPPHRSIFTTTPVQFSWVDSIKGVFTGKKTSPDEPQISAESFTFLLFLAPIAFVIVQAFTGTYGINYGRIANNIASPDEIVTLLKEAKIRNVRIYDADPSVLKAFSGAGLEIVVGLPNGNLREVSVDADRAMNWVRDNVLAYLHRHVYSMYMET